MKRLLVCILLAVCSATTLRAADGPVLRGRAVDSLSREPVAFATVMLLRDTVVVAAQAADNEGRFALAGRQTGPHTLSVTMVGFAPCKRIVELRAGDNDAGEVSLSPGIEINEVTVSVQKPLVVTDAEKMTYSVEDDQQASTSTLEEIIRKIPQLSIDGEGNVLLNGQSNYKILLNGHSASSLSNNFNEVIRSMPASQINRIEVITSPSTKYEAEGVGGIINLITNKERRLIGYYGNVSAGSSLVGSEARYGSANLSFHTDRFSVGLNTYYNRYGSNGYPLLTQSRWENDESAFRFQEESAGNRWHGHNYGAGIDLSYQPDTLDLLTFNVWIWGGKYSTHTLSTTHRLDAQHNPLTLFHSDRTSPGSYLGGSAAINYERTLGRTGHLLTLSDEVEIDPDRTRIENRLTGDWDYTALYRQKNLSNSNTLQVDYVNPIGRRHEIEAGVKHIYRYNRSTTGNRIVSEEAPAPDERIIYRQHILGVYAGYALTFDKWSLRTGARMERTWNDAHVNDGEQEPYTFTNRQFNIVPYASLSYRPAAGHSLSVSYTQRLQRPSLTMLSPAVDSSNPPFLSYGNPHLTAAVFHSLKAQYAYSSPKWSASFALTSFLSNNFMSVYTFVDADGFTHSTYSNDIRTRAYGFNGALSYRPNEKLSLSLSFRGNYSRFGFHLLADDPDIFSFSQNLSIDFAVWRNGRILLGEFYKSGDRSLETRSDDYYYYYAGIKQQFFKKKLDVNLTCSYPFNKYTRRNSDTQTASYRLHTTTRSRSRMLMLRLSWRFGKQGLEVKRTARSIENDDLQESPRGAEQ